MIALVAVSPGSPDPALLARWQAVIGHTHNLRSRQLAFEDAKRQLVAWTRDHDVAAVGVGSPWEPVSAAAYARYEGTERDMYYSGQLDVTTLMDRGPITELFADLNRQSAGATLFYQDNETPKSRMGHAWWFGYHYDAPAWHDYSQDRPVQYWHTDPQKERNAITGQFHRRRSQLEITAVQRRAGAIGVFAHPTSWWLQDDRFVTNIAAQLGLFLHADGRLDGLVVMGYHAHRRWYQKLWFHLLDTGAVVPGFAEGDYALDSADTYGRKRAFMNFMNVSGPITVPGIVAAARRGACFMSTGAFLHVSIDGVSMGDIARTAPDQSHEVRIEAYPGHGQEHLSRIEVLGPGGAVLASYERFPGGVLKYRLAGRAQPHYVVVRAYGQSDDPDVAAEKDIVDLAVSNPVYLHPQGFSFQPQTTEFTLDVTPESSWLDGTVELQRADGTLIEARHIRPGTLTRNLPASARVVLRKDGRPDDQFYIAMENPRVQELLDYLVYGQFRRDYPAMKPGQVPPAAFRLDEMRQALSRSRYTLY